MSMKLEELSKELKNYINDNVFDIIIFGSTTRGKDKPNDIDILIIFKKFDESIYSSLVKKYHVTTVKFEELYKLGSLFYEILMSGYSVKYNKRLSEIFEFEAFKEIKIDILTKDKSKRKILYYYLKGRKDRNKKGIIREYGGYFVSSKPLIIRIPIEISDKFIDDLLKFCEIYKIDIRVISRPISTSKYIRVSIDTEPIKKAIERLSDLFESEENQ
ncbi:MAG: nucleotidyltransferase domain-containing protein [Nanopusillaceae archaeon]